MKTLKLISMVCFVLAGIFFIGLGLTLGADDMNRIMAQTLFNIMSGLLIVGILFFSIYWLIKEHQS